MAKDIKKIDLIIKGGFGFGNFGDDALMKAVYHIVKNVSPECNISFLCKESEYIQKIIPNCSVLPSDYKGKINTDILLYGGGTQFYSFPLTRQGTASLYKRIIRLLSEPQYIARKIIGNFFKNSINFKKLVAIGIGLGPFYPTSIEEKKTYELFKKMDFVSVRDPQSFDFCKTWCIDNSYHHSDLCYFPDLWNNIHLYENRLQDKSIKDIGIIVRDWPHTMEGKSYDQSLFSLAKRLRANGKNIKFISFATSDYSWHKRLMNENEDIIAWQPEEQSLEFFLRILSQFDLFITARYHGAVFGSILRKPVICIGIEQKLKMIANLLQKGAFSWDYPYDIDYCLEYIAEIDKKYIQTIEIIDCVVKQQEDLAVNMVNAFKDFMAAG